MNRLIDLFWVRIGHSPSTYPLTTFWAASMVSIFGIGMEWWTVGTAAIILSLTLVLLVLSAFRQDLQSVHDLVNSQHDDLVTRVGQLTDLLVASNIPVPKEKPNV